MDENVLLEKEAVEKLGNSVEYNKGFHSKIIELTARAVKPFYNGDSCLVLGPSGGGELEETLQTHFKKIVCVDGSSKVLNALKNKFPEFEFVHSLFEEFKPEEKFDTILMTHVLEHVRDPIELLKMTKEWVSEEGIIIIVVPNAFSFHRMLGLEMGLLDDLHELNESDKSVGHRRVYDSETLRKDITAGGLNVKESKGIFVKMLDNLTIEKLKEEQVDGFFKLGEKFPFLFVFYTNQILP